MRKEKCEMSPRIVTHNRRRLFDNCLLETTQQHRKARLFWKSYALLSNLQWKQGITAHCELNNYALRLLLLPFLLGVITLLELYMFMLKLSYCKKQSPKQRHTIKTREWAQRKTERIGKQVSERERKKVSTGNAYHRFVSGAYIIIKCTWNHWASVCASAYNRIWSMYM